MMIKLLNFFRKNGLHKEHYGSGLYGEVNYINGKAEGLAKLYYESGELCGEVNYINGKQEGLAKSYYKTGKLEQEINYKMASKKV